MQKRNWMSLVILCVSLTALIAFVSCELDSINTAGINEIASRGKPASTTPAKQEVSPTTIPYSGIQGDIISLDEESRIFLKEYTVDLDEYVLNADVPMEFIESTAFVFIDANNQILTNDNSVEYTYEDHDGTIKTIFGPAGAVRVKIGQEKTQYFTQRRMEEFITGYYSQSFGLWAGQNNDAGKVTITNDNTNFHIFIDTNEAADLQEVHLELYVNAGELPSKRPAPGQMTYTQENINADSVEIVIPIPAGISVNDSSEIINSNFYFIIHAALVADSTGSSDTASLAGETAYAAGNEKPGYEGKGAWFYAIHYNLIPFVESFFTGYCTPIDVYVDIFAPLTLGEDDTGEDDPPFVGKKETAFVGNTAGESKPWWFYIDATGDYDEATVHAIYAGQFPISGATAIYRKSEGKLDITLGPNLRLNPMEDEPVKIQGYESAPQDRDQAGHFDVKLSHEDSLMDINVRKEGNSPIYDYLVVHLDVIVRN